MTTRRGVLRGIAAGGAAVPLAALGSTGAQADPAAPAARGGGVRTGFEMLRAGGYRELRGQKVGMVANPTAVIRDLSHEVDVMHGSSGVDLAAVFGPEHGFRGSAQAGGSEGSYKDPRTGIPVYDAYAKTPEQIADYFTKSGIDTVVFDIQDVGARFYTYIWTMFDCMRAAIQAGKRFVVLDRPNPLGGVEATGPVLHTEYASGVGREPIAQQHAMTVGELARLFDGEFLGGKAKPQVVQMRGWRRGMTWEETGLPWVLPSPNMPTINTAVAYPGMGLFEAVNLSEGRGTTVPFEMVGAPYVDWHWADDLNGLGLPGVRFREAYFAPTFSKWVNQNCGGVQLFVTDRRRFDPIRTALAMIISARRLYPKDFAWRESKAPYWIDLLTGSDQVRTAIDGGATIDQVVAGWQADLARFRAQRQRYLLYR
ncbi:exo-beta-N-acetylmuramidase NamZ family protein [Actinoallomurus rhizosphaericola]|uniref:exo-beta-N-acetylmuramidase NamZ family protein n=1 Tax=Actinoallomurus rhizosphaericola TaxID=2952536 RepID=UPI0020938903|nr:DUF1343 domain-containing protein [Actinoallomurus rhizosphaericola]MCO5997805.1 DUF1343 domain-containing protein [Actinoallomurus rhizosphaericola]